MPPLGVLIKPSSSICNLRCKYCFYHDVSERREIKSFGFMNHDVMDILIKKSLDFADGYCAFAFQGGEPTLSGLKFFQDFCDIVDKYNKKYIDIRYSIQTNGMVVDDAWATFLKEHNFLVGLSLDGYKDINDSLRIGPGGKGTHKQIMETVSLFEKYKVDYNILCVVTNYVARHIRKVYSFFKERGFEYLQFIPCIDPLGTEKEEGEYSLSEERYKYFLKTLFDDWYRDFMGGNYISIRHIDNNVLSLNGHAPELCSMTGKCSCQFVVEANGGVYPCDFYVTDDWYLGNITEPSMSFKEFRNSENGLRFISVNNNPVNECPDCKWYFICRGGCRRDREPVEDGVMSQNKYCAAYKDYYAYIFERLQQVAQIVRRNY
jgi:uncharacterized protein